MERARLRQRARPAAGSSSTPSGSTPSRSTRRSTGCRPSRAVTGWVEQTPDELRLLGQGEPLSHACQAPARPRRRARALLRPASSRSSALPSSGRCCGSCRRASIATTSGSRGTLPPSAWQALLRVPPRELVRGRRLRPAAGGRRGTRRRRHAGAAVPELRARPRAGRYVRLHHGRARPTRQLLGRGARAMGRRASAAGTSRRWASTSTTTGRPSPFGTLPGSASCSDGAPSRECPHDDPSTTSAPWRPACRALTRRSSAAA